MNELAKGAGRAMAILDFVGRSSSPPTPRQIFIELGLPRSSGYDLIAGMLSEGFLERQPSGALMLGEHVRTLAMGRFGMMAIASEITPALRALQEATQESAQFHVLHGNQVLVTHALSSARSVRPLVETGARSPVNWTASGRLLVSHFGERFLHNFFVTSTRPSPTGRAITNSKDFIREVRDARRRRHAVEMEETHLGVCSIAAPVMNADRQCVAAVSLALPVARMMDSRDTLVALVQSTATKLSRPTPVRTQAY